MAELVQRLFTFIPQNALRIGGEQWSRTLGSPTTGAGFASDCSARSCRTTRPTSFPTSILDCATAVQQRCDRIRAQSAIGACMTGSMLSAAWTLTYNANSGNPFFSTSAAGKLFRRSGYHLVESSSLAQSAIALAGIGIPKRRTPIYLDITRNPGGQALATMRYSTSTPGHLRLPPGSLSRRPRPVQCTGRKRPDTDDRVEHDDALSDMLGALIRCSSCGRTRPSNWRFTRLERPSPR
jgi:hypothetical protein